MTDQGLAVLLKRRKQKTLIALFVAALSLRAQLVGIGPLFPDIQRDLGTAHAVVGLLGTIPVLCMGLFAPLAAFAAAHLGLRKTMTFGVAMIGLFGLLRSVAPNAILLVLATVPVGIGMGIGNGVAPLVVKEWVPERPASGTGLYASGIQLGAAAAALLAVPLAGAFGGWRWTLIVFSVLACLVLALWYALTRDHPEHVAPPAKVPRLPWRSRRAWLLVGIFAAMSCSFYGFAAWLPDAYVERGWSAGGAGVLLSLISLPAIPASFIVPWLSDRGASRRPALVSVSLIGLAAAIGLAAFASLAYVWALFAGIAQGGMFALVMTLPLDFEESPERTGGLVAMMLGVGYTVAATAPVVLGALRDLTGSFDAVLWAVVGFQCCLLAAVAMVWRMPSPGALPANAQS
jgi:MFS transporter, CP family, cyanate transporter